MTTPGTITIDWSHGRDTFCLSKIETIMDLEDQCKAGLGTILTRLSDGDFYIKMVTEPIRFGLIGAGMSPEKAGIIVDRHVKPPYAAHAIIAYRIVEAVMVTLEEEASNTPKGDPEGKEVDRAPSEVTEDSSRTTDVSTDLQSSTSELPSSGTHETSSV